MASRQSSGNDLARRAMDPTSRERQQPDGAASSTGLGRSQEAYVIDGALQNIGSYNRVITGTWTQGGTSGDFTVLRN